MYKNLNPSSIGVSGRQSEIIELAMTYGFRGVDVDLAELVKRSQHSSFEKAARYITSAKIKVGAFETPIDLDDDDTVYAARLAQLHGASEIAKRVEAGQALLRIPPATDRLPYHEYFNVIRKRIDEVAAVLAKEDIKLALYFSASSDAVAGKQFKFVNDVEGFLALFRACTAKNVGLAIDTWQWHVGGGSFEQLSALDTARVFVIRVADIAEDVDLSTATTKQRLLPGSTKIIDNVQVIAHFLAAGYKGPLTPMGHSNTGSGMTRDAIVAAAQTALDKVSEEAGIPIPSRKPEAYAETSYSY